MRWGRTLALLVRISINRQIAASTLSASVVFTSPHTTCHRETLKTLARIRRVAGARLERVSVSCWSRQMLLWTAASP
jgi:hypothetical protein